MFLYFGYKNNIRTICKQYKNCRIHALSGGPPTPLGRPQKLPADALFPNPTDGPLTLATDGMAQAVLVYTLGGNPVGGWRIVTLAPGAYLLSVATLAGTRTAKFIRR